MKKNATPLERVWEIAGSFAVACVLLAFLFILTFLGTIEQTEHGLYEVQKKYLESLYLVHDLGGVIPIPLPGVYLVLILLGINLLCGGIIPLLKPYLRAIANGTIVDYTGRTLGRVGVLVIHFGIVIMLAAGFVKLKIADDGNLLLFENNGRDGMGRSDEFQSFYEWEVAISDASSTFDIKEHLIPGEDFVDLHGDQARTFDAAELPFKVKLSRFERNCRIMPKGPMWTADGPVIDGYAMRRVELAKEAEQNIAGLYVRLEDKQGGNSKDAILWGAEQFPLTYVSGARNWSIDLRKKRFKMPFTVTLKHTYREFYPNTRIAKVFKSEVTKSQTDGTPPQEIKIEMNEPLRSEGLVLFQSGWGPEDAKPGERLYSVFAVVRNPADQWPLISCIVIAVGMLITFVDKLVRFLLSQQHAPKPVLEKKS